MTDPDPTPPVHPPTAALDALRADLTQLARQHLETGRRLKIVETQVRELLPTLEEHDDRLDAQDKATEVLRHELSQLRGGVSEVLLTTGAVERKVDSLTVTVGELVAYLRGGK